MRNILNYVDLKYFAAVFSIGMLFWYAMENHISLFLHNYKGIDVHIGIAISLGIISAFVDKVSFAKVFVSVVLYGALLFFVSLAMSFIGFGVDIEYIYDTATTINLIPLFGYLYIIIFPFLLPFALIRAFRKAER